MKMCNGVILGALSVLATVAFSQDVSAQGSDDGVFALEEVVVTARRREENLQQVPVSVANFSGAELEARSIQNIQDINVLTPNVTIQGGGTRGGAEGQFVIRGLPRNVRYVDGVVQSGDNGALVNIVDLERVEILRGPQGTLFGKNGIGGAIQFITKKPGDELSGKVKVTLGTDNRADLVGSIDIPLGDTVKTQLTVATLTREGHVTSELTGTKYGEIDNQIFRGQIVWTPNDRFSARLIGENSKTDAGVGAYVLYALNEARPLVGNYNNNGFIYTDATHALGGQERYANRLTYEGPGRQLDVTNFILDLGWNLSDSLEIRSITGFRDQQWGNLAGSDGSEFLYSKQWTYEERQDFSQEFQLLGSSERLQYTLGVYYSDREVTQRNTRWVGQDLKDLGLLPPFVGLLNNLSRTSNKDTAVYGELTFAFSDKTELTVGARYSEEEFGLIDMTPESIPVFPILSRTVNGPVTQTLGADFDAVTGRIALQHQWTENFMTYVSVANGFNGGGINSRFVPTLPMDGFIPFAEESYTNYEIGMRADIANGLNITYFTGTWSDIQVGENLGFGINITTNAGEADIEGFELESILQLTDSLVVNVGLGVLDSKYTDVGATTSITVNSPLQYAPDLTYNVGLQHAMEMFGGEISSRVDYGYTDEYSTIGIDFLDYVEGDYGLLSARFKYTSEGGNWDVAIFGTNLTNEFYGLGGISAFGPGTTFGTIARPREWGATFGLRF